MAFRQAGPVSGAAAAMLRQGVVKSWNGSKGYGFITADGVAGDVMFARTELPEDHREVRGKFLEGKTVSFQSAPQPDGRQKAMGVQVAAVEGQQLAGVVASHNERSGFGFLSSSSLTEDVHFLSRDINGAHAGMRLDGELVVFDLGAEDGRLHASRIMFQSAKIAERLGATSVVGGGGKGGGGKGGGVGSALAAMGGMEGLPAAFAIEIPAAFAKLAALGAVGGKGKGAGRGKGAGQELPAVLDWGGGARPEPERRRGGLVEPPGYAALANVASPDAAPGWGDVPAADPMHSAMEAAGMTLGCVKSFSEQNGYGFLNVPGQEVDLKFGRGDLQCETVGKGDLVYFAVEASLDGRLQAKMITPTAGGGGGAQRQQQQKRPAMQQLPPLAVCGGEDAGDDAGVSGDAFAASFGAFAGAAPPAAKRHKTEVSTGQQRQGTVKSYNGAKGFGFINTAGVGGDIFFMKSALPEVLREAHGRDLTGQSVRFEVMQASDGQMRAGNIAI